VCSSLDDIVSQLSKLREAEEECMKRLPDKCYLPEALTVVEEVLREYGISVVDPGSLLRGLENRGRIRVKRTKGVALIIKMGD